MKSLSKSSLTILKLIISLGVIGYLFYKIKNEPILESIGQTEVQSPIYLVITAILMVANWGLEAKKWEFLIKPVQPLSFSIAFKSVLAGLTTGLFTPNRLGNFIGRLAFVNKEHHNQAIVNTLIGNLAQFVSTLMIGLIGLLTLLHLEFNVLNSSVIIILSLILISLGLLLYFKPIIVDIKPINFIFSSKTKSAIQQVNNTSTQLKINILSLSFTRYMVFCVQYYLLFLAFESAPVILFFGLISSTFLITTLIPSLFFGKLFVRESVAIFVFSTAHVDTTLVLIVAFLLWLFNLAIPALIGSLIWLKQKQHG